MKLMYCIIVHDYNLIQSITYHPIFQPTTPANPTAMFSLSVFQDIIQCLCYMLSSFTNILFSSKSLGNVDLIMPHSSLIHMWLLIIHFGCPPRYLCPFYHCFQPYSPSPLSHHLPSSLFRLIELVFITYQSMS